MASNPIRVAVLRFVWAPGPVPPDVKPHLPWPDALYEEVFRNVRDYWLRATFGLLRLEFDFSIAHWWRLDDRAHADLYRDRPGMLAAARRVVEVDNGISLAGFANIVAFMHAPPCNAGATGGGAVLDQDGTIPFFQHEMGHVLGFQHAFGFGGAYNDPYCVMGKTNVQAHAIQQPAQFMQTQILKGPAFWRSERRASAAAIYRRFSGSPDFVNSGWVARTAAGGRVWIGSLTETTNTAPVIAVLPVPAQPEALLTIEYRTAFGDDDGVVPAVVVHSIGAHDVGVGHDEVNPPWFEGTMHPAVGASFETLGVRFQIVTLFTGQPAGVEIQTGAPLAPPPARTARCLAAHSGKVLDVKDISADNGALIQQWDWWDGDNQKWRLEPVGDGLSRIVSVHSGKVLDVKDISADNGALIQQWDWWGGDNQKWRLEDVGDGLSRIVSVHSGKVLDVTGASADNGALIHQWDWVGGDNQKWRLEPMLIAHPHPLPTHPISFD